MDIIYNIDSLRHCDSNASICWRLNWISPFESPWGVFEKFKHANQANMKDLLKLFGNEKVRVVKNPSGRKYTELVTLNSFDQNILCNALQFDLVALNKSNLGRV